MRRGEIYLVAQPGTSDPRRTRPYVVVGRQRSLSSSFTTAICAPVYSKHHGLASEVQVGSESGLKHDSAISCDNITSLPKGFLTNYLGQLSPEKTHELDLALTVALGIDHLLD